MSTGYSGTPLIRKLGIKPGMRAAILDPPAGYADSLGALPDGVELVDSLNGRFDFIHLFAGSRQTLDTRFSILKAALNPAGMLWISWPKKTSRMPTDLNENIVRDIGLTGGLVDVKVVAVDATWSGLKFVYRLADR